MRREKVWARTALARAFVTLGNGVSLAESPFAGAETYMDDNRLSWNNAYPTTIEGAREGTASLLSKVLGITALGFLVTAVGVYTAPEWATLPGFIAVIALIFGINFTRKANPGLALGLFLALAYFMGWEIGPLIHRYIHTFGPQL